MRDRWKAGAAILGLLCMAGSAHAAINTSVLPPTCQTTVAQIQADKARFAGLGKAMTQARRASNTNAFCLSARQIIIVIKSESSAIDACVGELASSNVPGATDQMLALKSVYRQMLEAARNEKNDRFHCGLAEQ